MNGAEEIRERVRRDYSLLATSSGAVCCLGRKYDLTAALQAGYRREDLESLPLEAAIYCLGCGDPVSFADIADGDTVLDLGSGSGLDLLLAGRKTGPAGRVIGVDMTEEMLVRARGVVAAEGLGNVEVRRGLIEELPVDSGTVDWVISNCVINLSPEKEKVFSEIVRVLKPGGRMAVFDIVVDDLPDWVRNNRRLYSACLAGAVGEEEYLQGLRGAGIGDVEVRRRFVYDAVQLKTFLQVEVTGSSLADPCSCDAFLTGELLGRAAELLAGKVRSVLFYGVKPLI